MDDIRVILIGIGVILAVIGGIVLLNDIPPRQYPAIIVWLVAVLLAHDVVIAGIVFAVAFAGRRALGRMPHRTILVVQGALAVGGDHGAARRTRDRQEGGRHRESQHPAAGLRHQPRRPARRARPRLDDRHRIARRVARQRRNS